MSESTGTAREATEVETPRHPWRSRLLAQAPRCLPSRSPPALQRLSW